MSTTRKHCMVVVGARPNFMKVAPVMRALAAHPRVRTTLVHTGQHYEPHMSGDFLRDLDMGRPGHNLEVGSGTHAVQTAAILERFEAVLLAERPDIVVVAGDVNSTLAATLAAVKLHIPVGHIESGLRSRDRSMPEEVNRVVTDALSELLFAPSRGAVDNLAAEGIDPGKIHFVGNTMIDTLRRFESAARASDAPARYGLAPGAYLLATIHRPSNVDTPEGRERVSRYVAEAARRLPVIFPVHPRTRANFERDGRWDALTATPGLAVTHPLPYPEFLALMAQARLVLTDSGGVQEETTALRVPCLTLRANTERPVTVDQGTNLVVSESVDVHLGVLDDWLAGRRAVPDRLPELWDGHAGERIAAILASRLEAS